MPQRWIWSTRHRLMLALPWAGLLALSVSLAWAMTVGLTGGAQGVGGPESSQPLLSTGRALDADVDTFVSDVTSTITGQFTGYEADRVFVLDNGQVWQQAEAWYWYWYSFRPDVLIYPASGGWKLHVDGIDHDVSVRRLK